MNVLSETQNLEFAVKPLVFVLAPLLSVNYPPFLPARVMMRFLAAEPMTSAVRLLCPQCSGFTP